MRLSFAILLLFFGSANALPAITTEIQDSPMKSPELVRSQEVGNHAGVKTRSLRSHIEVEASGEDDETEERVKGANLFAESKLNQMMSSIKTFKRFRNWKAYGLSTGQVATRLENKGIYDKYQDLNFMYQRHYPTL
ncbi:Secreted RxLR effector peptide protein [Phytophthora palmivora]|uniref:RxLR effector protein n=1 Tax=Phytophthora palmivora TaxID=4796 RepID=A0A2P4YLQ1_9STRA|nr:Secreted RxLR effector peptide protein [Phytophthora palmivora]